MAEKKQNTNPVPNMSAWSTCTDWRPTQHLNLFQNTSKNFFAILRISDSCIPQRLLIVRSYDKTSSVVSSPKITERTAKLGAQLKELDLKQGEKASMHEGLFQGEPEEAWGVVAELFK